MSNINDLVMESFTISELELESASHQSGNLLLLGENTLSFQVDKSFSPSGQVEVQFNQSLKTLKINEAAEGKITDRTKYIVFESLQETKEAKRGTFKGGGTLTYEQGMDFDFNTNLLPGIKYNILEKSGFPGSTVYLTRVK